VDGPQCRVVNVGTDHDTAAFAVNAIRRWWRTMGEKCHPKAKRLMITADGGGSNGYRVRLWKFELQMLADELKFPIPGLPPATRHEQVEQDRAPSFFVHHDQLSRQAVAQLLQHRPTDLCDDNRYRSEGAPSWTKTNIPKGSRFPISKWPPLS
jgi:hypothetical protein